MAIDEFKLALLTQNLVFSALLIKGLADAVVASLVGRDYLESGDLLVSHADFFVQKEDVVLEAGVEL